METRGRGRTLMVMYECTRCGKEEYMQYTEATKGGGVLTNCKVPEGWADAGYFIGLLCSDCFESLRKWMKEGVNNEAD